MNTNADVNDIHLAFSMINEFETVWLTISKEEPNQVNYRIIKSYLEYIKKQLDFIMKPHAFDPVEYPDLIEKRNHFMRKCIPLMAKAEVYLVRYKEFDFNLELWTCE
ncbi:uncharacterized protein LOC102675018 isoform X1 [Apis dorsata]|uniref:uncharacterized protein LOC102675018 isoform X1 n=1 Tax=Apis dorsata TaxID=7462 RepID=UPI0003DF5B04|nr:uncharacterized protein LOC102675018 isoform X1 [Apis dorsata]XP_028523335.1 uncharacterized protein LOC114577753 isoform X1 [Apis cerana]